LVKNEDQNEMKKLLLAFKHLGAVCLALVVTLSVGQFACQVAKLIEPGLLLSS
jgi:hypothetical protein